MTPSMRAEGKRDWRPNFESGGTECSKQQCLGQHLDRQVTLLSMRFRMAFWQWKWKACAEQMRLW